MKVLIYGSSWGGREEAMERAVKTDGTAKLVDRIEDADIIIPGPEKDLAEGIADKAKNLGVLCCGPTKDAARLESSKAYARRVAREAYVPSPLYKIVENVNEVRQKVIEMYEDCGQVPVVKADGLAAGKGVFLPDTFGEAVNITFGLLNGKLGDAGKTVVLEQKLQGTEASLFYACNGEDYVKLPHAKDHKRIYDGDKGPNTGGMGAISPNPIITPELEKEVEEIILQPTLKEMCRRNKPFVGFLFLGLMITDEGPKLLEYNVRLGDPETQAILPRLEDGEFLRLCVAVAENKLKGFDLKVKDNHSCVIVLASEGYPGEYEIGKSISVNMYFHCPKRHLIYAGTKLYGSEVYTNGGRVLNIVAQGKTQEKAIKMAYDGIGHINFNGMYYRRDIGN